MASGIENRTARRALVALGVCIAILLLGPSIPAARAETPEELVEHVQHRYETTRDLEASFTQRATLKTLNETQISSGKLYIKKPGKMRWDYLKPENQVILLKNDILSIYTPDINQILEQQVADLYRSKHPAAFLAGQGKITEIFSVRVEPISGPGGEAAWHLALTPKEDNPQLKELRLEVKKPNYDIVRSVIVDHFGNVTDIRYNAIRINRGLDETVFALKLPPGVKRVKPPSFPLK
jgi:outer membrane lipoprotein carrier protein